MSPLNAKPIILQTLEEGDMTSAQVCKRSGVSRTTVLKHLVTLLAAREIHVCDYKRSIGTSGAWARIYRHGKGKNKPQPKKCARENDARYWDRFGAVRNAARRAKRGTGVGMFAQLMAA